MINKDVTNSYDEYTLTDRSFGASNPQFVREARRCTIFDHIRPAHIIDEETHCVSDIA